MRTLKRHKKLAIILGLLLLSAALVIAAGKLSGQANALAQDSGIYSAEMESLTLATIRNPVKTKTSPTAPPPCDWRLEKKIRTALDKNDAEYKTWHAKAKAELAQSGQVSGGTKAQVLKLAAEYKSLCDQYATMWSACNCTTRANTAQTTGESRVKSAAVVVSSDLNGDLLKAMEAANLQMRDARKAYARTAVDGQEISDEDKAFLQTLQPRAKTLVANTKKHSEDSRYLLMDIKNNPRGGGSSSGSSGGSDKRDPVLSMNPVMRALFVYVQILSSESQGMFLGARYLLADILFLAIGLEPFYYQTFGGIVPCFVDNSLQD